MKTEFTWENFRSEAIAVGCRTGWEAKQFLSYCQKQGFAWDSGAKINPEEQTYHSVCSALTCYIARAEFPTIQYRDLSWAIEHGFKILLAQEVLTELGGGKEKPRKCATIKENPEKCVPIRGDVSPTTARWRDAESDKPIRDGEYVVLIRWIADGKFHTGQYITVFDTSSGRWGVIDDNEYVITHWLDGVPELPEVVVR